MRREGNEMPTVKQIQWVKGTGLFAVGDDGSLWLAIFDQVGRKPPPGSSYATKYKVKEITGHTIIAWEKMPSLPVEARIGAGDGDAEEDVRES
jgi:hypothetical protein